MVLSSYEVCTGMLTNLPHIYMLTNLHMCINMILEGYVCCWYIYCNSMINKSSSFFLAHLIYPLS